MNLTLLTDLYQLTMIQGYYECNRLNKRVVFDLFYRKNPFQNGYAIMCGLEQVIDYIKNIKFTDDDIEYLKGLKLFNDDFINYLKTFKFTGDIYAIEEGTVIFPHEPLIRVCAPIIEAQLIETTLLNIINHQSLIATKAARIVWAAQGDSVLEFGLRRAQGPDAALFGARAAIIGGCSATSNVLCGKMFNVPVSGTHAHSWIMSFDDELSAFRKYAQLYPDSCILLVDTYDTLSSGVPNAITVFSQMRDAGVPLKRYGIRLDSGDFAYLPKVARQMLDDAGFNDALISASSDLDENLISSLKTQGTKITLWGVGTNLITSNDCPAFGGVYKLAAQACDDGSIIPKIKLSDNPEKITNPGFKKVYRLYDKKSGRIKADLITLVDEVLDDTQNLTLFDPHATWRKMTLRAGNYTVRDLLVPIFLNGQCVYSSPSVLDIKQKCKTEMDTLWDEYKRLINPHILPVDLSQNLFDLKKKMIEDALDKK